MKAAVRQMLENSGLENYCEALLKLLYPSVRMITSQVEEATIPIGRTKIGGKPDLPQNTDWPYWRSYRQSFICQINCSEIAHFALSEFPKEGILYFFYAASAMDESADFYDDKNTTKVLYFPNPTELQRTEYPEDLPEDFRFTACTVTYKLEYVMPTAESSFIERLGMSYNHNQEDYNNYWQNFQEHFREEFGPEEDYVNRIMGHPEQVQGDLQMESVSLYHNLAWGDPKRVELASTATDWRLLLQIDSEDDMTGMMWGDVGKLYYMIRLDHLKENQFSESVCIMQCG